MIRSKRNQPSSRRISARRMLAALVLSATSLHVAPARADDVLQRLTKPEELARIAPMRAIGLRLAAPKALSSFHSQTDEQPRFASPAHPAYSADALALPARTPHSQPPLPVPIPDSATIGIPTLRLPPLPGGNSDVGPAANAEVRPASISTASHVPLAAPMPAPAGVVPASMSAPVDTTSSPDRVSFRLGEPSGTSKTTNPKPVGASQPPLARSNEITASRESRTPISLPPSPPSAFHDGGSTHARMPQQIKPQSVRTHSTTPTNIGGSIPRASGQYTGTDTSGGQSLKVTKSEGITQHTPVRLSFSNDSITAAPLARTTPSQTVMRSGSEIPVNVRSLAPNSKVLQATKSSQPALVAAVPLDPESPNDFQAKVSHALDDATLDRNDGLADPEAIAIAQSPSETHLEPSETHLEMIEPSPTLPIPTSTPNATLLPSKTTVRSAVVEPAWDPSVNAPVKGLPNLAQGSLGSPDASTHGSLPLSPSLPTHSEDLPPALPKPALTTLDSPHSDRPTPRPTPAILASRLQGAKSESSAPANTAYSPRQGRISLAQNASGGLRIVPVDSNPEWNPDGIDPSEPRNETPSENPPPTPAPEKPFPSLPPRGSMSSSSTPSLTQVPPSISVSPPTRVETIDPSIADTDTPATPDSHILPNPSDGSDSSKIAPADALEDLPPALTIPHSPHSEAMTKDSLGNTAPVLPRGPIVTTGPLESGVVPESSSRLEIESQSANEFLVEGKITFIHIVDANVCRAVASDGKIFVVGNELGETSIAIRTAESTDPIFVRVAVVTPWQKSRQGVTDIEQLRATIANVVPEAKLRIQPQSDGSLWVIGTVDSNDKAKRVMELTRKLVLVPVVDKLEVR